MKISIIQFRLLMKRLKAKKHERMARDLDEQILRLEYKICRQLQKAAAAYRQAAALEELRADIAVRPVIAE
jgi:hypothetical protein